MDCQGQVNHRFDRCASAFFDVPAGTASAHFVYVDDALLQNKSNKHVLEDFMTRAARVRGFLEVFRPGLLLDLVAISDVAGPTGWDPDIQALVVSKETISGGAASKSRTPARSLTES